MKTMKFTRTLALIAGAALLLSACNKESDEAAVTVQANSNPLLAYVPADTAYVFAALEPVPVEISDAYIARFQPVMDLLSEQVRRFQSDFEAGELQSRTEAQLAVAILDELGGKVSTESLENLGISLQSHHVFYAMGVFPVMRIGLSDEQKLRDALARIESKMGVSLPASELNGSSYWRIAQDDSPVGLYIAILEGQLAISVFPVGAEDSMLTSLLGQETPSSSMASTNSLAIMNASKGYTAYGSGMMDLQKLADEIFNADSITRSYLGSRVNTKLASVDEVCIAEFKSIVAKAPRMTIGTTNLTSHEYAMSYELEMESTLAGSLAALVSDTPIASSGDYLLSASLAVRVGKLRNFLLEKANETVASPYQCEQLQKLNHQASELVSQLNIPMPPMVNNLLGVRVLLDDIDPTASPIQASGLVALHVDKPEMFVGMATMMVPGFEELDLPNQSEPVKIPSDMYRMDDFDVYALMGDSAIGAAIGQEYATDLGAFMNEKPQQSGTFLSVSYDMARQMEIQKSVAKEFGVTQDHDQSGHSEFSEAIKASYEAMLGRSSMEIRFTQSGLVINSEVTFK
jgi:hypothetical protein